MNTFNDKILNSVEFLNVFQLKLLCKQLKIKGYSGKKKLWIQTRIRKHLLDQQEKEIQETKGLFCYPEIIQTIYEYHSVDDVDLKRLDLIKNAKTEIIKIKEFLQLLKNKPENLYGRTEIKYLCREKNYRNICHVKENYEKYNLLIRTDFHKFLKEDLKKWLKTLHYKPNGGFVKLRKKQLYNLVIEKNNILMSIQ